MKQREAVQHGVSGIGVLKGADIAFEQPTEFPCDECGGMVDLSSPITVRVVNMDGTETEQIVTEADARALLSNTSIPPPPIMCNRHDYDDDFEVKTWAQGAE